MNKNKFSFGKIFAIFIIIYILFAMLNTKVERYKDNNDDKYTYSDKIFSLITTPENKVLEETINKFARKNAIEINITYADNLDIVDRLNSGEKYDAVWASNSIWLDMLDSTKVSTSDSKSTSVTPIVIGIKNSKAKELGLINKQVKMKDLLSLIKSGKLKFSMANPITTNSGAASYLNILSTLAGNPDVLTSNHLKNKQLQEDLKTFFTGLVRTSGDEDFLNKSFVDGDYDAAITYESSIVNINKELVKNNKETLYLIYPVDGVSICDSPLVYINNRNDKKKKIFLDFQSYILSDDGQNTLLNLGRRTWYGGVTDKAPSDIFNKEWGIDTTKYISPIKYPAESVIKEALELYQTKLRKPVHVVFCLDYSGSMYGEGMAELQKAMEYIFSDEAKKAMIQFTSEDKIDVIAFGSSVKVIGSARGNKTDELLKKIKDYDFDGATALYPAATKAIEILAKENDTYNSSVILMTDGEGNIGTYHDLLDTYNEYNKDIPIYSITFGYADLEQLENMAELSNGKVFDGKSDLVKAFKTVRGYN
jgi:Ca-activated chloride channel family protein